MRVESPCTNVCRMNDATGYCRGCFRTLAEITAWRRLDDAGKQTVLQAVAERAAANDLFEGDLRGECER